MASIIESKEYWEQQLEKLKTSGLSRTQYCNENGVNYDRFGYWIKKLRLEPSAFVPVKIQAESAPVITPLCTLELRNHVLKIHDLSALSFLLERLA